MYSQGGIFSITSRILVVDLLSSMSILAAERRTGWHTRVAEPWDYHWSCCPTFWKVGWPIGGTTWFLIDYQSSGDFHWSFHHSHIPSNEQGRLFKGFFRQSRALHDRLCTFVVNDAQSLSTKALVMAPVSPHSSEVTRRPKEGRSHRARSPYDWHYERHPERRFGMCRSQYQRAAESRDRDWAGWLDFG